MTSQCRSSPGCNWTAVASQAHSVPGWCKAFDDKYHRGDVGGVETGLGTTSCRPAGTLSETDQDHAMHFYHLSVAVFDNEHLIPTLKKMYYYIKVSFQQTI